MFWDGHRWLPGDGQPAVSPTPSGLAARGTGCRPASWSRRSPCSWCRSRAPSPRRHPPAHCSTTGSRPPRSPPTRKAVGRSRGRDPGTPRSMTRTWATRRARWTPAAARVGLTFTGTAIAWVGPVGPTRGSARVYHRRDPHPDRQHLELDLQPDPHPVPEVVGHDAQASDRDRHQRHQRPPDRRRRCLRRPQGRPRRTAARRRWPGHRREPERSARAGAHGRPGADGLPHPGADAHGAACADAAPTAAPTATPAPATPTPATPTPTADPRNPAPTTPTPAPTPTPTPRRPRRRPHRRRRRPRGPRRRPHPRRRRPRRRRPTPTPTPAIKSVRVTSIPALLTALADNTVDEIVVANGTYRVSPACAAGVELAVDRLEVRQPHPPDHRPGRDTRAA